MQLFVIAFKTRRRESNFILLQLTITYMFMEMVIETRFHFLTFPYYLWGELEIQQIGLLDLQFQNLHMFNILECTKFDFSTVQLWMFQINILLCYTSSWCFSTPIGQSLFLVVLSSFSHLPSGQRWGDCGIQQGFHFIFSTFYPTMHQILFSLALYFLYFFYCNIYDSTFNVHTLSGRHT